MPESAFGPGRGLSGPGVSDLGGVWSRGCLLWGCLFQGGVSGPGMGVCSLGGGLIQGVSAPGGYPGMH